MGKIFVLLISVPLMIVAIVCALFADRIDTVVKGNKEVKKVIIVFSVGVLLVCTIAIRVSILSQIS
ncbi:protein CrcB-like protein [uncultured Oscillibacter sp.]|uniref:protein CrcB-like protein n=1 Tax=uncultured Oscillibacter sp. TaxID=876091 RepID=UPI00263661EA|nr:protein CrcB-like protein [uncultured Oscillibacter sp.]